MDEGFLPDIIQVLHCGFQKDLCLSQIIEPSRLNFAPIEDRSESGFLGISASAWARVGVIAVLFAAVFWPNLRRLWLKTNPFTGEPNWSHSVVVPIIGLYFLFVHREDLAKANARPFIWGPFIRTSRLAASISMILVAGAMIFLCQGHAGVAFSLIYAFASAMGVLGALVLVLDWSLATVLFGLGVFVYGIYPGQNDYVKDMGMVITLFGIVLLMTGWDVMRIAWFPIVFIVCAIPWPGLVYSWVAEPLQDMAAHVAVGSLNICGVDSLCSGTKIIIYNASILKPPRVLNVAEACAGMRSLMTFISIAAALAFLSNRPLWQKLFMVVSAIPIAIFCNVMRISGQGLLDHYASPQWSESFAHQFVGMVMLIPALFLIIFVGYVLDKIFIEESDEVAPGILEGEFVFQSQSLANAPMVPRVKLPPPVSKEKELEPLSTPIEEIAPDPFHDVPDVIPTALPDVDIAEIAPLSHRIVVRPPTLKKVNDPASNKAAPDQKESQ